jgi:hypothetical protein
MAILRKIKQYEEHKDKRWDDFISQIKLVRGAPCNPCWATFIRAYVSAVYFVETGLYRNRKLILPKPSLFMAPLIIDPNAGYLYGIKPKSGYTLDYDFRSRILAINFYNLLMLDFDLEKEGLTFDAAITYLTAIADLSQQAGYNMYFAVYRTDRGLHAFLVSHEYEYSNLAWIEFMLATCNDPWYTAFSYVRGFGVRITKKPDRPEDFIAEIVVGGDTVLNKITFDSLYYGTKLELNVFTMDDNFLVVGDRTNMRADLVSQVLFQYLAIQYGRTMSLKEVAYIECQIYDEYIRDDTSLDSLRQDIKNLRDISLTTIGA